MATFLIILGVLLFLGAIALLPGRQILAPAVSFLGLLVLSFAKRDGYQILPINNVILIGWLCMTMVVMLAVMLQAPAVRAQTRGMGYITGGALAGMVIGLLAFTFASAPTVLYGTMIVATAAGIFFGFLLYTNTPDGRPVGLRSGHFFQYLLAKGFPAAITVMQIGVALVLTLAVTGSSL